MDKNLPNPNIAKDGEKTRFTSNNQPKKHSSGNRKINTMISNQLTNILESKNVEISVTLKKESVDEKGKKTNEEKSTKLSIESQESIAQLLAYKLINVAVNGTGKNQLAAIKFIIERTEGKMPIPIETTMKNNFDLSKLSNDELIALEKAKATLTGENADDLAE